jgi:hypothetical protein
LRKRFYLLADHINTTLIRGIELESSLFKLGLEKFADNAKNTGCFAYSGRSGENEVGNGALGNTGSESIDLLDVTVYFVESFRSVFFQPNLFHMALIFTIIIKCASILPLTI